jgi:Lon protease-like protein
MSDDASPLADVPGTVRLFPLPNLVLFPQVVQPLHIFEPRYRQMTADALADDRLIAMALLQPGWEANYDGRPGIYPVVCLGRIAAEQRLDDGRFNLLLRGLARVRIVEEVADDRLYRSATVEAVAETAEVGAATEQVLRHRLTQGVRPWFAAQAEAQEQLQRLLDNELPLGVLCDVLAFTLPLPAAGKQALLEEVDVAARVRGLLEQLAALGGDSDDDDRKFPPEFSAN